MAISLVSIDEASVISERSPSTIRRWIRNGRLTRHTGTSRSQGGSPPVLIDQNELFAMLATSGQQPRADEPETAEQPGAHQMPTTAEQPATAGVHDDAQLTIARLEGQLALAQLRGELLAAQAELEVLRKTLELERQERETERLQARVALRGALEDRDDWRGRHDAARSEVHALQGLLKEQDGAPWWRKLLGGPTLRELPHHAIEPLKRA